MTYKKPLKAFNGTTLMGESVITEDTDNARLGSYAIEAFEAHKTVKGVVEDAEILVPFHAIKSAMYATLTEDAERTDPYCGGGTDELGELIIALQTPTLYSSCDDPNLALWLDTVSNFSKYTVSWQKEDGSVVTATDVVEGEGGTAYPCRAAGFRFGEEWATIEVDAEIGNPQLSVIGKFYRKAK